METKIKDTTLDQVVSYVTGNFKTRELRPDKAIAQSWYRCLEGYGLEPHQACRTSILSEHELTRIKDDQPDFFRIGRCGAMALHHKMRSSGYAVLLTDHHGTTLDAHHPSNFDAVLSKNLIAGACWSENLAGTNGIGTCVLERKPLIVHRQEHFLSKNALLSCSVVPILDPLGELLGCLDASVLVPPGEKHHQHLSLRMVLEQSRCIEDAYLRDSNTDHVILSLQLPPASDHATPPILLAINHNNRIIGANSTAIGLALGEGESCSILGAQIERLVGKNLSELEQISQGGRLKSTFTAGELGDVTVDLTLPKHREAGHPDTACVPKRHANQYRHPSLHELCAHDAKLRDLAHRLRRVVDRDIPIVLIGETGTGKEAFAHAIHQSSSRHSDPFVALNCAAIPESLIESELFGYRSGSFTGANKHGMKGKLQLATGGTLFLDEIGDMPLELQTRLLRVLAEREIQPLGANEPIPLDIQLISATHQDLPALVSENSFRQDLYYRLNGMTIELPPLRERTDLKELVDTILGDFTDSKISLCALVLLEQYHWPGNIRQLVNTMRLAAATADGQYIQECDLPDEIRSQSVRNQQPAGLPEKENTQSAKPQNLTEVRDQHEAEQLIQCLRQYKWNISRTAKALCLSRSSIYRKMKKYHIVHPREYS